MQNTVWVTSRAAQHPEHVILTMKRLRFASCFGDGNYRVILEKNLLEAATEFRFGLRFTSQQNNNPKHAARTMIRLFA